MNENHYTEEETNRSEGRQVQDELERQLRAFGDTMSDAFRTGFEGRGEEIGDRAWGIGKAAAHAANYGIRNAKKIFGLKEDTTPIGEIRASAKKRYEAGCVFLAVGITFLVIFGLGAVGSAIGLSLFWGTWLYNAVGVVSGLLALVAAGFGWMTYVGAQRMKAAKLLEQYADAAESFDYKEGIPLSLLAELTHQKPKKAEKRLRDFIRRGWLKGWLDEKTDRLYLTVEDYRAAQEKAQENAQKAEVRAAQASAEKKEPESPDVPRNLEIAKSFVRVLGQEKALMKDERAVEELDHMQKTTQTICDWLATHPESLPKLRRFAEYYIPTTLKLLHTYNDVQGQQGENAENIRRDIAGILHTLNQAYDNLYDNLLSDVALDVSSEIAALQGMMANDGLTGEGLQ